MIDVHLLTQEESTIDYSYSRLPLNPVSQKSTAILIGLIRGETFIFFPPSSPVST